jgi:antitoxin (DNA-binding transcriptional repressor) of toxin-antitoxin stability system
MGTASERTVTASDFAAQAIALMDEVARTGHAVTILREGKPVARLVPPGEVQVRATPTGTVFGLHRGKVHPIGAVDLDAPVMEPEDWAVLRPGDPD